ncbi:MAG: hypothetical protein H6760_03590 [Candidatus Nomurabacteria bacterium]|nr:MAG: hypothetical protein H6760_03590 [Candidatus Nomurabacteria bacterium]
MKSEGSAGLWRQLTPELHKAIASIHIYAEDRDSSGPKPEACLLGLSIDGTVVYAHAWPPRGPISPNMTTHLNTLCAVLARRRSKGFAIEAVDDRIDAYTVAAAVRIAGTSMIIGCIGKNFYPEGGLTVLLTGMKNAGIIDAETASQIATQAKCRWYYEINELPIPRRI